MLPPCCDEAYVGEPTVEGRLHFFRQHRRFALANNPVGQTCLSLRELKAVAQ